MTPEYVDTMKLVSKIDHLRTRGKVLHDQVYRLLLRYKKLLREANECAYIAHRVYYRTHPEAVADIKRGRTILGIEKP